MSTPEINKRKGKPRIPRRLSVRFGTEAKMCGGQATDISEGGMRVESTESFPVNSILTVFVQFPRHAVRLKARVMWCGGKDGGTPSMGLALTQPEPALKRAVGEWLAEVKQAASETEAVPASTAPATASVSASATGSPASSSTRTPPASAAPAPPAAAPAKVAEPRGPVRRRLESRQGQSYEALLERDPDGWTVTIVRLPRSLGVGRPDFEKTFDDYPAAETALRDFVRSH